MFWEFTSTTTNINNLTRHQQTFKLGYDSARWRFNNVFIEDYSY